MTKNYPCPNCDAINKVDVKDWDEQLEEKLPETLLKGAVTAIATVVNPLLGLATATVVYGEKVVKYVNGKSITCSNCKNEFIVRD